MNIKNLLVVVIFSFSLSSAAQELLMPEISGYKKTTDFPVYNPENLIDYIKADPETFLSYEFIDLHVAKYKKGKNEIILEIFRLSDNNDAFGIYSSERSSSFRFMNLGSQGYIADKAINFFKGEYYVKIRTTSKSEKAMHAAESLALRVSNMLPGDSKMPAVLSRFPETGKKLNEETYISESVLGHKFLDKAFKALYEIGTDNFSIFILEEKSSEKAKQSVDEFLKSAGMDTADGDSGKYLLRDINNGTVFLAWKENDIVIISGLSKDQTALADQYTSEILK